MGLEKFDIKMVPLIAWNFVRGHLDPLKDVEGKNYQIYMYCELTWHPTRL